MGLAEVGQPAALRTVFDNVMRLPPNSPFGLDWDKAESWVNSAFAPHTAKFRWQDTWTNIENNLNAHRPVLLR